MIRAQSSVSPLTAGSVEPTSSAYEQSGGIPAAAQTIPPTDAKNHIGENATVCGLVVSNSTVAQSQGTRVFIDLAGPYPDETFMVVIWELDKAAAGTPPSSGQLRATGTITDNHDRAEIVLNDTTSWSVPSARLSNDR